MDLVDYLRILRRRWPIVAACCVVSVLVAILLSSSSFGARPPASYIATTTLVQPPGVDRPLEYVALLITTGPVPAAATTQAASSGATASIDPQIDVLTDDDSGGIQISVTDRAPDSAIALANALANEIIASLASQSAGNPQLRILQRAGAVPVESSSIGAPSTVQGRVLLSLGVGLLLGTALALALERFDTRLRDRIDVQRAYGIPVLAEIPRAGHGTRQGKRIEMIHHPSGPASEAYRSLRSSILLVGSTVVQRALDPTSGSPPSRSAESPRLLLVTSADAGEGKTTTVVNLAAAFSEAGKYVVVIDCDFRKPSAHEFLDVPRSPGLSDFVRGEEQRTDVELLARPTIVPRVRLITAGSMAEGIPLPARTSAWVSAARELADIVIIDTPPLLVSNEAMDLMPFIDTVLIVCRAGRTTAEQAERSSEILARLRVPVVGAALIGSSAGTLMAGTSSQTRRRAERTS